MSSRVGFYLLPKDSEAPSEPPISPRYNQGENLENKEIKAYRTGVNDYYMRHMSLGLNECIMHVLHTKLPHPLEMSLYRINLDKNALNFQL